MEYSGTLTKMQTEFGDPIQYYMVFEDNFVNVNQLLGRQVEIIVKGSQCLNCSKRKRVFRQGYCYDCFTTSASVGDWIMRPELSQAHLGIADRDLDYEVRSQLQPHVVYLAATCEVKVGVTRKSQVPTRWIDQGACSALIALEVPNRYLAGITEVALKSRYADKTNWRRMLINDMAQCDLPGEYGRLANALPHEVREFYTGSCGEIMTFNYPVLEYPKAITPLSLEKTLRYTGTLTGIRGQYLLFADGSVLNVRAAEGTVVTIAV